MTGPTNSLGFVKFGRKVIKKNKSVVEEVEASQKTVADENAAPQAVETERK